MTKVLRTRQSNRPPPQFHRDLGTLFRTCVQKRDSLITATEMCCICRFVGCPTLIALPHGLDISTTTAKIMKSLLCTQAGSLTKEVGLQLHGTMAERSGILPRPISWVAAMQISMVNGRPMRPYNLCTANMGQKLPAVLTVT